MMNWLLPLLFLMPKMGFAAESCWRTLLPVPAARLGIGVLVEDQGGRHWLGVSSYAGSNHRNIVQRFAERGDLKRVLWLGELRYATVQGLPEVVEANETSGYYREIRDGLIWQGHAVEVRNSVNALPLKVRSADFQGYAFDPANQRLAKELQGIAGDVRHSVGNSLQVLVSASHLMKSERKTLSLRQSFLDHFVLSGQSHLALVNWLVLNLFEEGRINEDELAPIFQLNSKFNKPHPRVEDFADVDSARLDSVVRHLSQMISPSQTEAVVNLFEIP